MSVPITTRLDDEAVAAIDRAVRAGAGSTRAAVVAAAVHEWLSRHSEEAIAASYQRAYAEPDTEQEELVARVGSFSARVVTGESEG